MVSSVASTDECTTRLVRHKLQACARDNIYESVPYVLSYECKFANLVSRQRKRFEYTKEYMSAHYERALPSAKCRLFYYVLVALKVSTVSVLSKQSPHKL